MMDPSLAGENDRGLSKPNRCQDPDLLYPPVAPEYPKRSLDWWKVMSDTIPAVSERTISDWVGQRSFRLGRSYFENDAIFDSRRQGSALKACCQGSMPQPYRLRVAFGAEGIEEAHCSCPVGGGGHCKHVGALLLAWQDQPDTFREVAELDTDLERRSKGELIALIKQMLQLRPDLETFLEVALPGGDRRSTPVNPESYRRQVSSAFRRGGDDWMASRSVATDIGVTLTAGDGFLALADHASASTVYQAVAQGILEHYGMFDDEDGLLCDVMGRCVEGLGTCFSSVGDDAAARENSLHALFDIFRFDVDYGGVGLGEAAPDIILEHATCEEKRAVAGWVRAAMPQGNSWTDNYHRQVYGRFLLDLEMAHLDDVSFLSICRECGLLADLVNRLMTLGRLEEAIAEAELAGDYELLTLADIFREYGCAQRVEPLLAKRIETSRDHRLVEWLKEHYKGQGDLSEALALAKRLLERWPHLAGYQEVRELSRQLDVWHELRPQLLAEWSAAKEYGLLTDIYLEEGEIDLALKSVNQRKPGFRYGEEQLIRVAQSASQTHPHAAFDIYRQQAESLIEARGRDNYQRACTYLAKARDLYRQLSRETAWTDYIAELRERHRRLPALKEELSNAGL